MLGLMLEGIAVGILAGLIAQAPWWFFLWQDRRELARKIAADMTTGAP